jgi:PKD repeat protein
VSFRRLATPVLVSALLAAALAAPGAVAAASPTFARTINTGAGSSNWTPDSPDPSGLAWVPSRGLFAVDGEVEENTGAGWHDVNAWFATTQGSTTEGFDLTSAPTSPSNKEPVGAAYDAAKNELYVCKDGSDGIVWVYNASTMALLRTFTVNGGPYNNRDPEGLGFGNGVLYMVDAIDNDLVKVQPGGDGIVGTSDDAVSNFDVERYGQLEPEGLDVHPDTGNIWIVSNRVRSAGPDPMIEVSPSGALVSSHSIAAADPNSAGGLAIAPPSDGSGGWAIYIADRGEDNNDAPNENDGKIYEFRFDGGGGGGNPPVANFSSSQAAGTLTVNFTDTSTGSPTSRSWTFGDGGTSSGQNPSHTYAGPGTYTVSLTVSNDFGSDTETKQVNVVEPSSSGNLLQNAGFEQADGSNRPLAWKTSNQFTRTSDTFHGGAFSGRLQASNGGASTQQDVQVTGGGSYVLSGWVNMPTTSDAFKFNVKVQWRSGSGKIGAVVVMKYKDDNGGSWQAFTGTPLTAPAGATIARVQLVANSLIGPIYVDDFSFGTP